MLASAFSAYWPGLFGDFLFDDHVNLNALGRYGGVRDLQTLLFYLTSGIADPTGRPVAMASFLLDAQTWPADPFPFKRTNLLIHLLNGLLLHNVLLALGSRVGVDSRRVRLAALIATTLWLFNPLWASTVLYVVQRHAMLATLFVLAGIRTWVGSRNAFDAGREHRGWLLALLAVPLFGTLAGLSKANGFLLPALLAVLELSVLRNRGSTSRSDELACRLLIWLPALILLAYLLSYAMQTGLDGSRGRPWTLGERLITQPRVLCEYLWQLLVPGLTSRGIFADSYIVSRAWHTPWTTLPAMAAVATLGALAWKARRHWPVVAASIGFFLVGHTMESGVVMLELYFEHRNYLPATLLFWPLAWWVTAPRPYRRWLFVGVIGYASIMFLTTAAQARMWGDPLTLALASAAQNPHSARAQVYAFHQELVAGHDKDAQSRLTILLAANPKEPQYALNLLTLRCRQGQPSSEDVGLAAAAIAASGGLSKDINYHWLSSVLAPGTASECIVLSKGQLQRLLHAAVEPSILNSAENRARHQRLRGEFALRYHACDAALDAFNGRVAEQPRPEFVQSHILLLADNCGPGHAAAHLSSYLTAGAPTFPASSPVLRLRDKIMEEWWTAHWRRLELLFQRSATQDSFDDLSSASPICRNEKLTPTALSS